ncbi:MAG TPA: molybdopterin-dependent oxidoreductase [Candidatus Limnocylindrales bacterium]|jgi:DMSO/TMAO reductase YedYZ molybdopterin-dependent catalytic subunit|nr:molybdopterin-dependent oxidoreductase [Candidatus Limnocylindrales bacterium]
MVRAGSGTRLGFAGAVAVGAALATGELLSGLLAGVPSPLLAVARFFVDIQPPGAKELVVGLFGTADKLAFQILIILVALAIGALVGRVAATKPDVAAAVIAVFVGAGFLASLREPAASGALAAAAAAIEAAVGIALLRRLVGLAQTEPAAKETPAATGMPDWRRRSLLQVGGAVAVGSFFVGALGRYLLEGQRTPTAQEGGLPTAPKPADLPPGTDIATADLTAAGLTPIVVPNEGFYRIDTAFVVPTVDRASWSLKVTGLVDREVTLTYDQLVALPIVEQYVTIACVSNEVGGELVGNAKWTGVALRDVLSMAGVQATADQLVGRSVDGFTAGMPVEWVMDESRTPMIAVAMNGQPLPRAHGYPARLIVPGLYGYVSATKWLSELELTRFDAFQAFWVPRGWAPQAPILTQSRIDVPRQGARIAAGKVAVAGVAWAPDRGVRGVEVRIDEGDWQPARISPAISKATWVQWLYSWDASPGSHTIEVRATDGTGQVQTDTQTPPAPDGARGHHTIGVAIT